MQKKYWVYNKLDDRKIMKLVKDLNITKPVAKVLLNRKIEDNEKAKKFLNPNIEQLYDPYLLKDMDKVVSRIENAIKNEEKICIYGDYDVDGIASISIILKYFNSINYPVSFYIPDRIEEGYGLNEDAIEQIYNDGTKLIITVDCGISSVKEVDFANSLGIDIIITDHHECQEILPKAYAIINPMQENCKYPFDKLCGCGLAFKLIQALTPEQLFKRTIYNYLDITAIATVADVVPLIDENRIIVKSGLNYMSKSKNIGIQALLEVSGLSNKKLNTGNIAFGIAPRINAAGRMSTAKVGVKLLTTTNVNEAAQLANLLNKENKHRQQLEEKIFNEAINIIEANKKYIDDKILIVYGENWHTGIIGIVASSIVEKYYKPTIILNIENGIAKGSARSIPEFDIFKSMNQCKDLFIKFGGHHQAAGLTIDAGNLEIFCKQINLIAEEILTEEDLIPKIMYDDTLQIENINEQLIDELELLEPFGIANPSPKFVVKSLIPTNIRMVGSHGKHLKLKLQQHNNYIDGIGFNLGHFGNIINYEDKIDAIFAPEYNIYNGNCSIQLNIKDIKISESLNYKKHKILEDYYKNFSINLCKNSNIHMNKSIKILKCNKDNIIEEKVNKASVDNPIIILVNTLKQAYKLLSALEYRQHSNKIKISTSYKKPKDTTEQSEVYVVINPAVDKIEYKRYNSIIIYDMFYFVEQLKVFADEKNVDKTTFLYDVGDEKSNAFVLDSIIPTREQLVAIYKHLKGDNFNKINTTFEELYLNIEQKYNLKINEVLFNNSLAIFAEGNLLNYKFENGEYSICMMEPTCKVDLMELKFVQNLQNIKQQQNNFKNVWLQFVTGRKG